MEDHVYLGALPTNDILRERINKAYDGLLQVQDDGALKPYCCVVCDEFIVDGEQLSMVTLDVLYKRRERLQWDSYLDTDERIDDVESYYRLPSTDGLSLGKLPPEAKDLEWLNELALSPYATKIKKSNHKNCKTSLTCCSRCKAALQLPDHNVPAIANSNYVGATPDCLTSLTEVELAFLTPTKSHGYCFTYSGGKQRNLRGTLVFMRVKERRIARGVIQLEALGLTDNVIVICHGKMTEKQRVIARKNATVRTDKLLEAVEWLCDNNRSWKEEVDLDSIRHELEHIQPQFIDHSEEVDNDDTNVETKEVFSCYFPDGSMGARSGGLDDHESFKDFVYDMREKKCDIEFVCNLEKQFVNGGETDEFVSSCLLQFPYGVGGMNDLRLQNDGSFSRKVDIDAYIAHLSKLSQPQFHRPLFVLILYNLTLRRKILKNSFLQVPNKVGSAALANHVNIEDLTQAVTNRRNGNRRSGNPACLKLLNAVDATSRAVPHSDDAAKKARSTAETLQHHFGSGSIFLTVTFDDENSLIVQVLANRIIDPASDVNNLTDAELQDRTKQRHELRLEFPGLCALNFEMLNSILIREVVGWNVKDNCATKEMGAFGEPVAFALAVEEQGRKTLHGHMTIWIKGYRAMLDAIHNGSTRDERLIAEQQTKMFVEQITTTNMFSGPNEENQNTVLLKAIDHVDCSVASRRPRGLPKVIEDQALRNLRHKHGYNESGGVFAMCNHCEKAWTYEELLAQFLVVGHGVHHRSVITGETNQHTIPLDRLRAMVQQYQRNRNNDVLPSFVVNALHQHHRSNHVPSCFKCRGKRKHICGPTCECRYRLPDKGRRRAKIRTLEDGGSRWFSWTGRKDEKDLLEILPARRTFDLFQNVAHPAISASKFTCNNNVSLLTEGPISQYQFKYNFKPTNDDDTEEYGYVLEAMKGAEDRKHDDDRSEARRKIIRASFAHAKKNVLGPALASYITRHGQRFQFSHTCTFCPLSDLEKFMEDKPVGGTLQQNNGRTFFENCALHYLCRNDDLESLSVKRFYSEYKTCRNTQKGRNEEGVLAFIGDTGYLQHPSCEGDADDAVSCAPRRCGENRRRNGFVENLPVDVSRYS